MSPQAERVVAGDPRAAARMMRGLADGLSWAREALRELLPRTGRAFLVGLTGAPGTGKSTLVGRLVAEARRGRLTVGVVAIDPSSPFTGGAILGDRIRMQEHALDPGVFIHSLATRGHLGGLAQATSEAVQVLEAMGKELVIIETVGVGQDEIDIARLAHTVAVVLVPGMGDGVQAIKAGLLEIADLFVVNKADRPGADETARDLAQMLELRGEGAGTGGLEHDRLHRMRGSAGGAGPPGGWRPPIVKTIAIRDQGIAELWGALEAHRRYLAQSGEERGRRVARARADLLALLRERLVEAAVARLRADMGELDEVAARIASGEADPYRLADDLAARLWR